MGETLHAEKNQNYKTKMCYYGAKCYKKNIPGLCSFAHSWQELNNNTKYCKPINEKRQNYKTKMCFYGTNCYKKNIPGLCCFAHSAKELDVYKVRQQNQKKNIYEKLICKTTPNIQSGDSKRFAINRLRSKPLKNDDLKYREQMFNLSMNLYNSNIPIELITKIFEFEEHFLNARMDKTTFKCGWCSHYFYNEEEKKKGWPLLGNWAEKEEDFKNRTVFIKTGIGKLCFSCYNNKVPVMCDCCQKLTSVKHINLNYNIKNDIIVKNLIENCNCQHLEDYGEKCCHGHQTINEIGKINNKCDDCLIKYWQTYLPVDFSIPEYYINFYLNNGIVDQLIDNYDRKNCGDYFTEILEERFGKEVSEDYALKINYKYKN